MGCGHTALETLIDGKTAWAENCSDDFELTTQPQGR